jgi:hypothetical protein
MEKFKNLVLEANKTLRLADHMLYVTYPLIKDNKLLVSILENIDKSIKKAIDAFIRYDLIYKRIRLNPESFRDKIILFSKISTRRYNFNEDDFDFIKKIDDIIKKHKESPVEFAKGDKFVICYNHYKTKILTFEDMKSYILKAKPFIVKLNNILQNDELLRRIKR